VAKQDVKVELYYSGGWQDVTAETLVDQEIVLSRGLADETLEPQPGRCNLAFLNTGGKYNPNNPTSPLYGLVGRNTPLRVSVDGDVQQVAEVAAWKPTRPHKATSRTGVEGAGVLRRLGRGKTPLRPALERAVLAGNPAGYWRLDDVAGATEAASALPAGRPLAYDVNCRPGVVDGTVPLGGGKHPNFMAGDGSNVSGLMTSGALLTSNTSGYAVDAMFYIDGGLSFSNVLTVYSTSTSIGGGFSFRVSSSGGLSTIELEPLDLALPGAFTVDLPNSTWHHFRAVAIDAGSALELHLYVNGVLVDTESYASSSAGRATTLIVGGEDFSASNVAENLSLAHVVVWDTGAPPTGTGLAGDGYLTETAADRIERLCTEEGIPITIVGTAADSQPMGSQPIDTLTELLLECARTDAGMLYEDRDSLGFVYRVGRDLYNQDPVLTLDFGAQEIAPPLEPVIGDLFVRNDVEAKSRTGSARATLPTGAMSTQDPPNGVGRYDTTLEVNPADDGRLPAHAGWHLGRGTVAETRFRTVVVDLDAAPARAVEVSAVDIGDLVVLTNLDPNDSPDDARGLVTNIAQKLGSHRRLVTFTLIPASSYDVGTIGAADGSIDVRLARIDTALSTLNADVTAYATSLSVASTGGILWTTTAAHFNAALNGGGLFIAVGGEVMRVTNITGASSPQTFTVVRSINGVVKAHSSGAQVRARYPARIGL
jgi:hypothetical protein